MDHRVVVVSAALLLICAEGLVATLRCGSARRAQAIISMHNFDYDVAIVRCSANLNGSHVETLRLGVASVDTEPLCTLDLCSAP